MLAAVTVNLTVAVFPFFTVTVFFFALTLLHAFFTTGALVGAGVTVPFPFGACDGAAFGTALGTAVGTALGTAVGTSDGAGVSDGAGASLGFALGATLGSGDSVGAGSSFSAT